MFELSYFGDLVNTVIDLMIVTVFCYMALKVILKSQKQTLIINSVLGFLVLYTFANILELRVTSSILNNVFSWGIVIIVVLFQVEIREALEKMGDFGNFFNKNTERINFLEELTDTIFDLKETKTGVLISITNDYSFKAYTKNAVEINSDFSSLLIKTIFNKEAPLHDGAVVIQDGRITHASVYYPISLEVDLDKSLGTRHRAAMTISELTNAVTIIVSEETGNVSITHNKRIYRNLNSDEFLAILGEKLESELNDEKIEIE